MTGEQDQLQMRRALSLAMSQHGRTGKNPAVGCVILNANGQRISEGATGDGGTGHAEQIALRTLPEGAARGGTAYVTLEPCRARSKGGTACSELLEGAGIARLVCAIADKHPNGSGGFERLRKAGVVVEIGLLADEADRLYADFFSGII